MIPPGPRRGLLAAVALVVGLYAGSQSFALAVRQSATGLAARLSPGNAQILATRAEALTGNTAEPARWADAVRPARAALLRDPLMPSAAATLGLQASMRGDDATVRRALAYSRTVSRRDLRTHLWAIEYSVSQGDVAGALRHYDIALRTSRQAPDLLFPVLASAAADPGVRRALVPVLLAGRQWGVPFVNHLANAAPDHRAAAAVFAELRARRFVFPEAAEASLLGALVGDRDFATARRYLAAGDAGYDAGRSRHPRFLDNPQTPSPFDWTLPSEAGIEASLQQGRGGGVLAFSAVPGVGGPVLRQLHLLPAGRYVVASRFVALDPAGSAPLWTVHCIDGDEIARAPVRRSNGANPVVTAAFAVPRGCAAQWLTLSVSPSDAGGGVEGEVDLAEIRPVGGEPTPR